MRTITLLISITTLIGVGSAIDMGISCSNSGGNYYTNLEGGFDTADISVTMSESEFDISRDISSSSTGIIDVTTGTQLKGQQFILLTGAKYLSGSASIHEEINVKDGVREFNIRNHIHSAEYMTLNPESDSRFMEGYEQVLSYDNYDNMCFRVVAHGTNFRSTLGYETFMHKRFSDL